MSGIGKRFIDAGYKEPKPLITVDDKPIIEHVVNLFPGESRFTFICNEEHLKTTSMSSVLERIAPQGTICAIPAHKKGPVYAVAHVYDLIDDEDEVIINYCDFSMHWNYHEFLHNTRTRNADGAIPAYRGFHPHMLGTTNYAFIREKNGWMLEIKEKAPFTDNRMLEFASTGTYYFKKGSLIKRYFNELMASNIHINDEFYVSLIYNLLVRDHYDVSIYEIEHMLQWGTPQDLEEYQHWSNYFKKITDREVNPCLPEPKSTLLIPLAGKGSRFSAAGYTIPKPLIPVNDQAMIVQAAAALPSAENQIFVCLKEHVEYHQVAEVLMQAYPSCTIATVTQVTQGQACTAALGMAHIDVSAPLIIGACDNSMLYDYTSFKKLRDDSSTDAIVFSFRHHPSAQRNPTMYGWLTVNQENIITGVSVKKSISDNPKQDHAIVGAFYFKKAAHFLHAYEQLIAKNKRVNNEFYIDSCIGEMIDLGYTVKVFEVEHYICWGTPDDLATFHYWQEFFSKCTWHPYGKNLIISSNPHRQADQRI